MKKLFLVVLVLTFAAILGVALFLDSLAAKGIERAGSHALGVDTHLASASVGLTSGRFGMAGLRIDNPPGFGPERFLELDQARLEVGLRSLTSEEVRVPLIELDGIRLDIDRNAQGTNYGVLLDNLERLSAEEERTPSPSEPGGEPEVGKRFSIEHIVIRDVVADVRFAPIGGDATRVTLRIPEITVDDARSDMTVAETFSLVVRTLLLAVAKNGGGLLPGDLLQDLDGRLAALGDVAFDVSGDVLKEVDGVVKDVSGQLGEAGEQALEKLGGRVEKDLGKLLGGKDGGE